MKNAKTNREIARPFYEKLIIDNITPNIFPWLMIVETLCVTLDINL